MTNFKGSKICTKCHVEKSFIEFYKDKSRKYGLTTMCKECFREKSKKYRKDNKEKIKKYVENNKEKRSEYHKEYKKKYYQDNKDGISQYYQDNKERINEYDKKYKEDNKEKINERQKEYFKKRKLNDPLFKFKCNLRSLICISIRGKGYKKNSKTFNILGCEYSFFMKYMEAQFKDGMTWENHGEWHIDHITPMYAAQTEEETLELNHYTNLQPLWAAENLFKSNKIITKKFKLL